MRIVDRCSRFLTNEVTALDQQNDSIDEFGKCCKVGLVLSRMLFYFSLIIFTSFYVMTDFVIAGKTQEIKEEVQQGVKETKEEFKKMPEELKKAGREIKKKSEEAKKNVEADIEEGKKNIQSITK
jgi:F0F1-type ATP synthase membrane subunit b/b'